MLLMTAVTGAWATEVTVTKTVNDLFPSVANGTQEATLYSDANLSISVNPDGNNGKVYGTGTEWRLYQVNSAVVTVTATEATIKTVAFTFTATNNGIIKYGGNAMTSGTAVNVNAASAQFVVGNSGAATNGQVRISGFTVVYETGSGSGEEAPTTKHLITATFDKQTRSLEQPLPYATTVGELYEAVTGEPFSDLISTMSALEMPLNGISSNKTDVVSIGELNGASTPVTVIADGQATVSIKFGNYAKGIYLSVTPPLYVTMKAGTQDADKWTVSTDGTTFGALPIGGLKGDGTETVTLKYNGRLKVKSVTAAIESAEGKKYMKWDDGQKTLVATDIPAQVTKVETANAGVTWPAGTYLVDGEVTISGSITLSGNVELIIKDDAKLTATEIVGGNYTLSVYGQTNMSGELNVDNSANDAIHNLAALNLHSCNLKANSSKHLSGGISSINTINVYGGSLDTDCKGSVRGYGIFDAYINIFGGEVKAVGMNDWQMGYGILGNNSKTIKVYGGKLWAANPDLKAIASNVALTKEGDFSGKIETSADGTTWTEYTNTGTPDAKYVRVGY